MFHFQVLKHLCDYRNSIVHRHDCPENSEELIYRLKGDVEMLMMHCLANRLRLRRQEQVWELMDLLRGNSFVAERVRLAGTALRLRERSAPAGARSPVRTAGGVWSLGSP